MLRSAEQAGVWLPASAQPLPGDIYFIARRQTGKLHIGIVREVDGRTFKGYEGNERDRISRVSRSLDTPGLQGFARLRDE